MISKRKQETNKAWREANKEHLREYNKKYREEHREASNKKVYRWNKENQYKRTAWNRKRRDNLVIVEHIDPKVVWKEQNKLCGLCGLSLAETEITLDHIIPISKGGVHSRENVQVAHGRCNSIKGNRVNI